MTELREWAEHMAKTGHVQARQVIELLDAYDGVVELSDELDVALTAEKLTARCAAERVKELEAELALARTTILQLSERVAAQSELLSRKAEKASACAL